MMTFKSVKEDLQASTLRAVSGLLGRLDYFASLRQEDGSYSHWGLSRVYGEDPAQRGLAEAHQENVSLILRTPIRNLLDDVQQASIQNGMDQQGFLHQLEDHKDQTLPKNPSAGSRRHLSSVLHALSALVKARQ